MAVISPEQARALRIYSQHLHRKASPGHMVDVIRSLCGVNAQSTPAMMLSLRARIEGLEAADVTRAIEQKQVVRTWAMRGTMHLLDRDDLGWMVSLLGPAIIPGSRRRRMELGLTDEVLAKSLAEIPAIFKDGPLTRGEIMDRLVSRGVAVGAGQAPYHLIAYAALKGLLCMGPDRPGGDPTYGLVDSWIGKRKHWTRDEALAGLVCRYLRGYGPAGPKDFAAWSGLSLAESRKGWELARKKEALEELTVDGRTLWSPASWLCAGTAQVVSLLPAFDAYVLGYFDREHIVPGKYQKEVYHGGQTVPVLLVDGSAAGVWRYERRGKKLQIKVSPFVPLGKATKRLIEDEADDVGRFFGLSASIDYA
jgi:hypothetical protein